MQENNKYCPVRQLFEEKRIEREKNYRKNFENYNMGYGALGRKTGDFKLEDDDKIAFPKTRRYRKLKKPVVKQGSMIPPRPENF